LDTNHPVTSLKHSARNTAIHQRSLCRRTPEGIENVKWRIENGGGKWRVEG